MVGKTSPRRSRRTLKDPFLLRAKHTDVGKEVLAGIMGWMTVVSSVAFYAKLFVSGEEGVDQDATVEAFELVAGLSCMAFGAAFNVPFIVAPSVLYAPREDGIEMGEHLADQFVANLATAVFFALALKLSFVSFIPTSLRLGAGCGISMLVSVLGMRSLGLLITDSFTLQPFTWQNLLGLAIITASCSKASNAANNKKKWICVTLAPTILTMLVYAVSDRSKFQGYSSAHDTPLSNWSDGSFGLAEFGELFGGSPRPHWFYVIRLIFSITINISSVLLVLIDAVCLEEVHTKVKHSSEIDFSNAIGGTLKFRLMACAIPLMSAVGNLMGATTQAAFVQSMLVVFAGGRTGLSTLVTGVMFVLTTVLWPLLPILVPGHVSGALTVVISLRFFTVIRMVDVTRPSNLLMFGMSILLIPFSFDFVDALCIATVLGFLCEFGDKLGCLWSAGRGGGNKVAVAVTAGNDETYVTLRPDSETGAATTAAGDTLMSATDREAGGQGAPRLKYMTSAKGHQAILGIASAPTSPRGERVPLSQGNGLPRNFVLPPIVTKEKSKSPRGASSSKLTSSSPRSPRGASPGPLVVHWGLALVAAAQLVLSVIKDQVQDSSEE